MGQSCTRYYSHCHWHSDVVSDVSVRLVGRYIYVIISDVCVANFKSYKQVIDFASLLCYFSVSTQKSYLHLGLLILEEAIESNYLDKKEKQND